MIHYRSLYNDNEFVYLGQLVFALSKSNNVNIRLSTYKGNMFICSIMLMHLYCFNIYIYIYIYIFILYMSVVLVFYMDLESEITLNI